MRKNYQINNRDEILEKKREYVKEHKKEKIAYDIEYRKKKKIEIAAYKKEWQFKKRKESKYRLQNNLRRRVHHAIKDNYKSAHTMELIGCTIDEFIIHIESQFVDGMTWENYGPDWHIDHIIPCYKFDLSDPEQQKVCFHYTNQRPLWAKDNLSRPRD